ncbi:hypothetical protein B0H12DRAFT_1326993 [Mycena haematopus]|nr:hypothetical protein B0H12DRAFT_1326993 [Mycena haematopus]
MHSDLFRLTSIPPATLIQPLPLKGEDNGATCEICGVCLRRNTDLPRHMLTHSKDKESLMFRCPVDGCGHQTLQKSNLATHIRTHTRAKPHKCPEYYPNGVKCDFSTADPSSLHRHRKRKHGYAPRPKAIPPRAQTRFRLYVPGREVEFEGDDVDAEGEPVSECESEESFGHQAEASNVESPADGDAGGGGDAVDGGGMEESGNGDEDDGDRDGEGEPENETEPVLLSTPPSHIMNLSSERLEPPPSLSDPPPSVLEPSPSHDSAPPLERAEAALGYPPALAGSPGLGLTLGPPVSVFANISDTRTYVDAQ